MSAMMLYFKNTLEVLMFLMCFLSESQVNYKKLKYEIIDQIFLITASLNFVSYRK